MRPSKASGELAHNIAPVTSVTRATIDDVDDARARIAAHVRRTPLLRTAADSTTWFKCEYLQHAGVFKTRGSFNRMLAAAEFGDLDPDVGVVAASGGNAGLANAYAARRLGVPATVFVPETAPEVKVRRIESYGARVVRTGREYAEAFEAAVVHIAQHGGLFCHAYDHVDIVAGAGTIGLEILEDLGAVDTVIVAVGGGGLFAGIATALDGRARIVAVEPTGAPSLHAALTAGGPVDVEVSGVAADSLGARRVGRFAWEAARLAQVRSLLVDDAAIVAARQALWDQFRIVVEHGAAAAYAALSSGAYVPAPGERVVVVLCGANTDPVSLGA